jgi:ArsR family transcriptional regulator, lead/cadmium/zinc/bismuth-responsive transcriptional repressor
VHLLPAERSDHRVIDGERACQAIAALGDPEVMAERARQFGPISVSDLAAATGISDATVSQTLRYLRASQTVTTERDGRVIRYRLADTPVAVLLKNR